jgi:hypothetical protein
MQRLHLEARAVTGNEEPMADLASQDLDGSDGRKLAAKLWIFGVRALRKNKPNAVVPWRFRVIPEHTNDPVAQVNGKPGKHAAHLGVQRHKRFQNEPVRSLLFRFGRTRHGLYGLSERTTTDQS